MLQNLTVSFLNLLLDIYEENVFNTPTLNITSIVIELKELHEAESLLQKMIVAELVK
jgi:hypothetical protein